jgi:hypothetical protein
MPTTLMDALRALVGHTVAVRSDEVTYTGTLASVTSSLVVLASGGGVVYIDAGTVTAVNTSGATGGGL